MLLKLGYKLWLSLGVCVYAKLLQSYPTLCDPIDYSLLLWQFSSKESACNAGEVKNAGLILHRDLLEEDMATHSSILAWKIPWTEEPVGLQSMHVCVLSLFSCI